MLMIGSMHSSLQTLVENFRLMAFLPNSFIKYLLRSYMSQALSWVLKRAMEKSLPA